MLGLLRLLVILLVVLFSVVVRRAGLAFLVPLGAAFAVGWPLSRLVSVPRRPYVLALAVLGVHFLWVLISILFQIRGFDTPVLGPVLDALVGDGEFIEVGYLGASFFRQDWMSPLLGCFVELAAVALLGVLLLRVRSPWPAIAACAVLTLLAARLGLGIMHDGWRTAHPAQYAHLLLRLTALGLILTGITLQQSVKFDSASQELSHDPSPTS